MESSSNAKQQEELLFETFGQAKIYQTFYSLAGYYNAKPEPFHIKNYYKLIDTRVCELKQMA